MKKLYSHKGPTSRVHPSSFNPLSALPTALIALASALSPDDQQVLAYLLGSHQQQQKKKKFASINQENVFMQHNHPPDLACSCFGCYKSFWARWDASPNRQVIHLIIDAFEETLESESKRKMKPKKKKKKRSGSKEAEDCDETEAQVEKKKSDGDAHDDDDDEKELEEGKSSVTRFVSWVFGMSN